MTTTRPVRTRSFDTVSWLTCYLVVLYAIPARLVFGPLGSAGAVSSLLGLVSLGLWLLLRLGRTVPAWGAARRLPQTLFAFWVAVAISYILAMSRPITSDEVSPADVALLGVASWSGPMLLAIDAIATTERLRTLVARIAAAGGMLAALGLVQFVSGQAWVDRVEIPGLTATSAATGNFDRNGLARPSATATHPIEYGVLLSVVLPIALHVAFASRGSWLRWVPAGLIVAAIATSSSRSAYLGAVIGVAVCSLVWTARQRLIVVGFGGVGLLIAVAVVPRLLRSISGLFLGLQTDPSIASRTSSGEVVATMVAQHPWFGRGLGTFLPKYRILDNQYLLLLVSVGVVGTLAFLAIGCAAVAGLLARAKALAARSRDRDLLVSLAAAVLVGFVSLAFFDAFAFPMTMGTLFLVLGAGGAALRLLPDSRPEVQP